MPNLHSHTYVRALAGFAEPRGGTNSNFWSWREMMYDLALALEPDELEAIACQAFLEMVKAGFTSVAEFHYLHNQPDGTPYANRTELAERIVTAARSIGIGLTLLPVLYQHGGVDAPLSVRQRRFGCASVDDFVDLFTSLRAMQGTHHQLRIGIAPHSVRAVTEGELHQVIDEVTRLVPDSPIHMHLSEQMGEVHESLARRGQRPGDWLCERFELSPRWTLIHATHCNQRELRQIVRAGTTVGLCPLTEAHLGDGRFPLPSFEARGGRWGIGTDSNTLIGVGSELRALEYSQRLALQRRAIHPDADKPVGEMLYAAALQGGATALAQRVGQFALGQRADLVHFDRDTPGLVGHGPETFLDALLVSGAAAPNAVMVGGRWLVRDGHHPREDEIQQRFVRVMRKVRARLD
jgi:formimidoylglutamate deiminase